MCTSPRLVDASVVDFAPSNFKCSSSSSQQIKELLEACFAAAAATFLSYKWQDDWGVEVEAVVYQQPVCIECRVYRLQSEVKSMKSYVILFRHITGDIAGCSLLCDKIRYQLLLQQPSADPVTTIRELQAWWGDGLEEDDNTSELYPGSMRVDTETMQRTMAFSTASAVRIDAARTLAHSCATHANRQLFLECGTPMRGSLMKIKMTRTANRASLCIYF
jgi:hypothetical protein